MKLLEIKSDGVIRTRNKIATWLVKHATVIDPAIEADRNFHEVNTLTFENVFNYFQLDHDLNISTKYGVVIRAKDILSKPSKYGRLPVNFKSVEGSFIIEPNFMIKSLEGCPQHVGNCFSVMWNHLISITAGPKEVGNNYNVVGNGHLESLEGCPKEIAGDLIARQCGLKSLKHGPREVGGTFDVSHNQLTSLEHGPREVGDDYNCTSNKITTLKWLPNNVGNYFLVFLNNIPEEEFARVPQNLQREMHR